MKSAVHRDGVINLVAACVLRSRAPLLSRGSMNTVPFEEYFDPMSILIEDATAPEAPEVIYDFIDSPCAHHCRRQVRPTIIAPTIRLRRTGLITRAWLEIGHAHAL